MKKLHSLHSQPSPKIPVSTELEAQERFYKNLDEVKKELSSLSHKHDPNNVLKAAEKKMSLLSKPGNYDTSDDDPVYKAMTLREFENGTLLCVAVTDHFKTFAIDFMRRLQIEYKCTSPAELATAELVALNFVRILDMERRMTNYLDIGSFSGIGVQYVAVLSKELDKASNQYFTALQALKAFRQSPFQLNIRTNTTVLGQNQVLQVNEINESN